MFPVIPIYKAGPKYAAGDDLEIWLEKKVGSDLTLNCTMFANPEANYKWSKNG